jgi:DNA-binding response OmpR family regulator
MIPEIFPPATNPHPHLAVHSTWQSNPTASVNMEMAAVTTKTNRLLIIDDSPDIRDTLRDFFEMNGYRVQTAMDGEEGLATLLEEETPDLVILDVHMPRLDGFTFLKEMKRQGIRVPVVMLTARGDQDSMLSGFDLGVTDYITKPFNPDVLLAKIRAILRRS